MADMEQTKVSDPSKIFSGTSDSKAGEDGMKIVVSKDGPYVVSGKIPLSMEIIAPNEEGLSWEWKKGYLGNGRRASPFKLVAVLITLFAVAVARRTNPFAMALTQRLAFRARKQLRVDRMQGRLRPFQVPHLR